VLPEAYIDAMRELNASPRGVRVAGSGSTRARPSVQREARADRPFHSADIYDWDAPR
jgi:hypothetical protein